MPHNYSRISDNDIFDLGALAEALAKRAQYFRDTVNAGQNNMIDLGTLRRHAITARALANTLYDVTIELEKQVEEKKLGATRG